MYVRVAKSLGAQSTTVVNRPVSLTCTTITIWRYIVFITTFYLASDVVDEPLHTRLHAERMLTW